MKTLIKKDMSRAIEMIGAWLIILYIIAHFTNLITIIKILPESMLTPELAELAGIPNWAYSLSGLKITIEELIKATDVNYFLFLLLVSAIINIIYVTIKISLKTITGYYLIKSKSLQKISNEKTDQMLK